VALRLVFCGTPAFAVPSLRHMIAQPDFLVESVVTQPDRPRGRGQETSSSPVKDTALAAGIAVYQPEKIKSDSAFEYFTRLKPDAVVIIAYGQIIPQRLIDIPRFGWINLHGSLLPKYRGASPIHWAIANGETRTGLTTMQVDAGLDTGPTLMTMEMEIGAQETSPELSARMAEAGAPLVAESLRGLASGEIAPQPQDHSKATVARLLKKEDGRIDWTASATTIYNRMRAFQPWPGAYTTFRKKTCGVWGKPATTAEASGAAAGSAWRVAGMIWVSGGEIFVSCGEATALRVESVQAEGRKRVTAQEFAAGARLTPEDRLGQ